MPRLWVDTDVALGASSGDVDDGFALAAVICAHRAGLARLLGVSTVSGNTSVSRARECAERLCEAAGVVVPLAAGTAGAERIALLPEGTVLLALGPLTNVARACRLDPELPTRTSLLLVGGSLSSVWDLPAALGVLGVVRQARSLRRFRAHTARYFRNRERVEAVTRCDPTEHWKAFDTLLASGETPSERLDSSSEEE